MEAPTSLNGTSESMARILGPPIIRRSAFTPARSVGRPGFVTPSHGLASSCTAKCSQSLRSRCMILASMRVGALSCVWRETQAAETAPEQQQTTRVSQRDHLEGGWVSLLSQLGVLYLCLHEMRGFADAPTHLVDAPNTFVHAPTHQ